MFNIFSCVRKELGISFSILRQTEKGEAKLHDELKCLNIKGECN